MSIKQLSARSPAPSRPSPARLTGAVPPTVTKTLTGAVPAVTGTLTGAVPTVTKTLTGTLPRPGQVLSSGLSPSTGSSGAPLSTGSLLNAPRPVSSPAATNVQVMSPPAGLVSQRPWGFVAAGVGSRRQPYHLASIANPLAGSYHALLSSAATPVTSTVFTNALTLTGSGASLLSGLTGSLSSRSAHPAATAGGLGRSVPPDQRAPLGGGGSSVGGATGLFFLLFAATLACLGLSLPAMGRRLRILRERGASLALVLALDRPD
jgi:hypothetical protein